MKAEGDRRPSTSGEASRRRQIAVNAEGAGAAPNRREERPVRLVRWTTCGTRTGTTGRVDVGAGRVADEHDGGGWGVLDLRVGKIGGGLI